MSLERSTAESTECPTAVETSSSTTSSSSGGAFVVGPAGMHSPAALAIEPALLSGSDDPQLTDFSWLLGQTTSPFDAFFSQPGAYDNSNIFSFSPLPDAFPPQVLSQDIPKQSALFNTASADLMVALARINETITNQLLAAETFPRPRPQQQSCEAETPPGKSANHVADALRVTSEFVDLVRKQTQSRIDSEISVTTPAPVSAALPNLSTPTALLLISAYLQLLHLFETVFHRVEEFFRHLSPQDWATRPACAQGRVTVTGIAEVDGRLQVRVVLQAIEHQLDTLGRLLGLPGEFCLSEALMNDGAEGLLGAERVSGLVRVVLGNGGRETGESARERIERIRGVVARIKGLTC
jgi:hypothetical protein